MDVDLLFPTPIFKFKVTEGLKDLIRSVCALDFRQTPHAKQTVGDIHRRKEFEYLSARIIENAGHVMTAWGAEFETVQITNCWANVYSSQESIHQHSHPNCFLSGCFYLKVPPSSSPILFVDPRMAVSQRIVPNNRKQTLFNTTIAAIRTEPGSMLFWPSWLQHFTQPNASPNERISIAFNIMFKGTIGSHEMLNALDL